MNKSFVVLSIVAVLLALILIVQGVGLVLDVRNQAACAGAIEQLQPALENQGRAIQSLLTDYEKAAYNNVSVDRITEQQLIAAESQLAGFQIIAVQNEAIITLLGVCR